MVWWALNLFRTVKIRIGENWKRVNVVLINDLSSCLWSLFNCCKLYFPHKSITVSFWVHSLSQSLFNFRWFLFVTKITILLKLRVLWKLNRILFDRSVRLYFRKNCISSRSLLTHTFKCPTVILDGISA